MDPLTRGAELPPGPALYCAIFAVDIAGYGDLRRDDPTRVHMHQAMYAMLARAFTGSGVPWETVVHEDRGDGVLVVVPGPVPHATLVDPLLGLLYRELRAYNRTAADTARIALRAALHAGQVQRDDHGLVGEAVNHTFRLLNAAVLKETLAPAEAPLAFIASEPLYDAVVRDAHVDVDPDTFREVAVAEKETRGRAWIHLPAMGPSRTWPAPPPGATSPADASPGAGAPAAAMDPRPPGGQAPSPASGAESGAEAAPGPMQGFVFHGVTHIAGDAVAGDKHVHAPVPPAAWEDGGLPRTASAEFLDAAEDPGELGAPGHAGLPDPAHQALPPAADPVTSPGHAARIGQKPGAGTPPDARDSAGTTRRDAPSEGGGREDAATGDARRAPRGPTTVREGEARGGEDDEHT